MRVHAETLEAAAAGVQAVPEGDLRVLSVDEACEVCKGVCVCVCE